MEKRKTKRKYPIQNYIILFLFIAAAIKSGQVYGRHLKLRQQVHILQNDLQKEKKLQQQLQNQKEKMNTDEYYEKYARDQLNLVKPGEIIFIDKGRASKVNP